MNRSLSVLLSMRDAQNPPVARIHEILELLPELTDRFELLITDDGSNDGAWELAHELVRQYPQVRLLRQSARSAGKYAKGAGVDLAGGDVVIAHDGGSGIDVRAIARLWRSTTNGRPQMRDGGFRLKWPIVPEELRRPATMANDIARKPLEHGAHSRTDGSTTVDSANLKTRRPNFLTRVGSRVRNFTVGE